MRRYVHRGLLALTLLLVAAGGVDAQPLPTARPEEVGLSSERLDRITEMIKGEVEKGRIPGAVALVARRGKVAYFEAVGFRDKAAGAPMTKDAIFRIASMTKPFTSVAIMMLMEDGRLQLADPASRLLPQLANLQVAVEKPDKTLEMVPATRQMTIQDLLRHTSGLTYGVFGKSAVKELYLKAGVDKSDHTSAELIDKLATVPLHYQPGTTWEYSRSTDVLGRVVEVIASKTLGQFFEERIFGPLKMADSGFWVRSAHHGRIAAALPADPDTGAATTLRNVTEPPKYESGGGGAVSTAGDYARFAQMMLNGGQLDGTRLLSRKTVELMTSDHLGDVKAWTMPGHGFGLGFAVRTAPGLYDQPGSVGEYTWSGAWGTHFWVDPKEQLVAVWMVQVPLRQLSHYRRAFKTLVMQAVAD
jgi:CubicO group peptidase (beta-lactamase class C family)